MMIPRLPTYVNQGMSRADDTPRVTEDTGQPEGDAAALRRGSQLRASTRAQVQQTVQDELCRRGDERGARATIVLREGLVPDAFTFTNLDGQRHGSVLAWASELGVHARRVERMLREAGCVPREVRDQTGATATLYSVTDVYRACTDMFAGVAEAPVCTFVVVRETRFGTARDWAWEFGVCTSTVQKYLERAGVSPDPTIRVDGVQHPFYAEPDVRRACAHVHHLARARTFGFFLHDGERYGSVDRWAGELGVSVYALLQALSAADCVGLPRGKYRYYARSDVLRALARRESDKKQCAATRVCPTSIVREGQQYQRLQVLAEELQADIHALRRVLRRASCPSTREGAWYYDRDCARKAYEEHQRLEGARQTGFVTIDGVRYGTAEAWARMLDVGLRIFNNRTQNMGTPLDLQLYRKSERFYAEPDVRRVLWRYIEDAEARTYVPILGKYGLYERGGVRHGTNHGWADELDLSVRAVNSRLRTCSSYERKRSSGGYESLYAEDDVRRACDDLLRKKRG